jgi:phage gp29-like protein
LGHENVGSFALGASKIDLFTTAIGQIARVISETFNQHAIPRLLKLNGMDTSRMPELSFGEITHVDLTLIADFIQKASASGALQIDDGMDEYLRTISGLPERDQTAQAGVPNMPNNAQAQPAQTPANEATEAPTTPEKPAKPAPKAPKAK